MEIEKSPPDERLAPYVRHYVSRRARLNGDPVRIALPARTQVILEFYFAAPHLVEIVASRSRERAPVAVVVGPQTFRRVDLLLSGVVDVFTVQSPRPDCTRSSVFRCTTRSIPRCRPRT